MQRREEGIGKRNIVKNQIFFCLIGRLGIYCSASSSSYEYDAISKNIAIVIT